MVEAMLGRAAELLARIDPVAVEAFVAELFGAWRAGRTVYVFGNGGSASTAQHLAADLFKCTVVAGKPRLRALCLNDNVPLVSALTNDEGWGAVYVEQLRTWWRPGDVAVGVSVHGGTGADRAGPWSQNVVAALRWARQHDGRTLALTGFDGGVLRELCDVSVVVPVDSTPLTEGLHVVVFHAVTTALRARITES